MRKKSKQPKKWPRCNCIIHGYENPTERKMVWGYRRDLGTEYWITQSIDCGRKPSK